MFAAALKSVVDVPLSLAARSPSIRWWREATVRESAATDGPLEINDLAARELVCASQ